MIDQLWEYLVVAGVLLVAIVAGLAAFLRPGRGGRTKDLPTPPTPTPDRGAEREEPDDSGGPSASVDTLPRPTVEEEVIAPEPPEHPVPAGPVEAEQKKPKPPKKPKAADGGDQ